MGLKIRTTWIWEATLPREFKILARLLIFGSFPSSRSINAYFNIPVLMQERSDDGPLAARRDPEGSANASPVSGMQTPRTRPATPASGPPPSRAASMTPPMTSIPRPHFASHSHPPIFYASAPSGSLASTPASTPAFSTPGSRQTPSESPPNFASVNLPNLPFLSPHRRGDSHSYSSPPYSVSTPRSPPVPTPPSLSGLNERAGCDLDQTYVGGPMFSSQMDMHGYGMGLSADTGIDQEGWQDASQAGDDSHRLAHYIVSLLKPLRPLSQTEQQA